MTTSMDYRDLAKRAFQKAVHVGLRIPPDAERVTAELVWNQLDRNPHLRPLVDGMTDEKARIHFGYDELLDDEHFRRIVRYFHAWRVDTLRRRLGADLESAKVLDVGDTDGLMLNALGKSATGFNISAAAVENIRSNGVDAVQGDGHDLPFDDASFDVVLCFEMLEHVENQHLVLTQLARVLAPEGRLFVSIPSVPRTSVLPRDPLMQRGYQHVNELTRRDFHNLVTHTPLAIVWEDVCDVVGPPRTFEQRRFLLANPGHIVAGTFRRFQFFELAHAPR